MRLPMRKISSDRSIVVTMLFSMLPALCLALVLTATRGQGHHGVYVAVVLALAGVVVGVAWLVKRVVRFFADEVFDDGEALVFRRGRGRRRVEQRVALADIWLVVDYSHQRPPKVMVEFATDAGPFGGKAVFRPKEGRKSGALVKALASRIDAAKRG